MLTLPTTSRCPLNPHFLHLHTLPLGLCLCLHTGHWLLVPRSEASEALDAGLCTLVGEIVDVLAIFPLRHTLVVVASSVLLPHPMRVADEQGPNLMLLTEVDHLPRGFMPKLTYPPFYTTAHPVLGTLQFSPAAGVLLTTRLLLGNLPMPHVALAFETADTPS